MEGLNYVRCGVCGNEYHTDEVAMLEWKISSGVSFTWCEHCDRETDSHDGQHRWHDSFVDTLVAAIQDINVARIPG